MDCHARTGQLLVAGGRDRRRRSGDWCSSRGWPWSDWIRPTARCRFQFDFGRKGPTVNAANPVVFDDHLFVTASYGIGAVLARLSAEGAAVQWRNPQIMASQYTTCVEDGGWLYGVDGRQDGPAADLHASTP